MRKAGMIVGGVIVSAIIIWAGYRSIVVNAEDMDKYEEQPAWMHYLPKGVRYMIIDIQKIL